MFAKTTKIAEIKSDIRTKMGNYNRCLSPNNFPQMNLSLPSLTSYYKIYTGKNPTVAFFFLCWLLNEHGSMHMLFYSCYNATFLQNPSWIRFYNKENFLECRKRVAFLNTDTSQGHGGRENHSKREFIRKELEAPRDLSSQFVRF